MKIIVCTGNSHTCGQGAKGFLMATGTEEGYNTAGKGIGRNADYGCECYVRMIQNYINKVTNSSDKQITYSELSEKYALATDNNTVMLNKPIEFISDSDLIAIKFAEKQTPATADIYIDDKLTKTELLHAEIPRYGSWSYRLIPLFNTKGKKIKIVPKEGDIFISSIECFSGEYAVINSGIGSCTTKRYLEECFDYCVSAFSPDIIIAEAHTINDWLSKITPSEYKNNLSRLIDKMKEHTKKVILTTVSPILGNQAEPFNAIEYSEFIKASSEIEGVYIADAHTAINERLKGLNEEEKSKLIIRSRNSSEINTRTLSVS